ncbi:MAG TPA: OmpA family protein [Candidatus Binataceae bacterium]|nr:OmpA family protein [Candidatus Binataceae bacterium]
MNDLNLGHFVDRDTFQFQRDYPHPIDRAWSALTNAEQVSIWLWPCTTLEAEAGGRFVFDLEGNPWRGHLTEFDPPRVINFGGAIRFELSAREGGCRMVLTLKRTRLGWSVMALAGFHGWLGRFERHLDATPSEQTEDWAKDIWGSLFFAYEREVRRNITGDAKAIHRIHFEENVSALNAEAKAQLDELIALLKDKPNLNLNIDGFGDDPCTLEASMELSAKRVAAASEYLREAGIASDRIMVGFVLGNYHYLVPRDAAAGRAFNRRIELRPIY